MWCWIWTGLVLATTCTAMERSAPGGESKQDTLRLTVDGVTFEFVRIPGGTFLMGSDGGDGDERPVREVRIADDFYMGKTEVTVRQFRAFVEATGYKTVAEREGAAWHMPSPDNMRWARGCNWRSPPFEQTDDYPVVCLSYLDAGAFCAWLSTRSGQPIRLPTEAEWEYACRAGTKGDGATELERVAWFGDGRAERPHPVAQKAANAWGLHDMLGNAAEWCEDVYRWHYREASADGSANLTSEIPAGAAVRRVLRGGSWCTPSTLLPAFVSMPCSTSFGRDRHGFSHRPIGPVRRTGHTRAGTSAGWRPDPSRMLLPRWLCTWME